MTFIYTPPPAAPAIPSALGDITNFAKVVFTSGTTGNQTKKTTFTGAGGVLKLIWQLAPYNIDNNDTYIVEYTDYFGSGLNLILETGYLKDICVFPNLNSTNQTISKFHTWPPAGEIAITINTVNSVSAFEVVILFTNAMGLLVSDTDSQVLNRIANANATLGASVIDIATVSCIDIPTAVAAVNVLLSTTLANKVIKNTNYIVSAPADVYGIITYSN